MEKSESQGKRLWIGLWGKGPSSGDDIRDLEKGDRDGRNLSRKKRWRAFPPSLKEVLVGASLFPTLRANNRRAVRYSNTLYNVLQCCVPPSRHPSPLVHAIGQARATDQDPQVPTRLDRDWLAAIGVLTRPIPNPLGLVIEMGLDCTSISSPVAGPDHHLRHDRALSSRLSPREPDDAMWMVGTGESVDACILLAGCFNNVAIINPADRSIGISGNPTPSSIRGDTAQNQPVLMTSFPLSFQSPSIPNPSPSKTARGVSCPASGGESVGQDTQRLRGYRSRLCSNLGSPGPIPVSPRLSSSVRPSTRDRT